MLNNFWALRMGAYSNKYGYVAISNIKIQKGHDFNLTTKNANVDVRINVQTMCKQKVFVRDSVITNFIIHYISSLIYDDFFLYFTHPILQCFYPRKFSRDWVIFTNSNPRK